MISNLVIGQPGKVRDEISASVMNADMSLTVDAVSQLSLTIHDPGFRMLNANYFQIRMPVDYDGMKFEVSVVEAGPGDGPQQITLDCRSAACQKMKRDKGQKSWGKISPSDFAKMMADQFGLKFFGQPTPAKDEIVRVRNEDTDESTWDILSKVAGDSQYWMFESDGRLFFTSQTFLLGKYANISIPWPPTDKKKDLLVLDTPTCRRSEDDPNGAECELLIHWEDGVRLRPGMTFGLTGNGMKPFGIFYLITEVSWKPGQPESVRVVARTPVDPKLKVV
jgi:hypothetical protein